MTTVIVVVVAVAMFALGASAPLWGLAIAVGGLAMTPSLAWQLGFANLALPWLGGWALCLGVVLRLLARRQHAAVVSQHSRGWLIGGALSVLVAAGVVGLARSAPTGAAWSGVLADLTLLRAPGWAGELQAAAMPALGLTIAGLSAALFGQAGARALISRAIYVGCALAALGPVVQTLLLDPNVRPDWGLRVTDGAVGFFQDPHSLATVLAIGIGLAVYRWMSGGGRWASIGLLALSAAGLSASRSRTGLLAALVAIVVALALANLRSGSRLPVVTMRAVASGWLAAMVLVMVVAVSTPGAGAVVDQLETLEHLNVSRWFAMRGEIPADIPTMVVRQRSWLWRKAGSVALREPMWGVGPGRLASAAVVVEEQGVPVAAPFLADNAHNYPLQLAAEFGWLPAAGWLLVMSGAWLLAVRGRLRRPAVDTRSLGVAAVGLTPLLVTSLVAHPFLLAEIQLIGGVLVGLAFSGSTSPSESRA